MTGIGALIGVGWSGRKCMMLTRLDGPATTPAYVRMVSMKAFPHMSRRRLLGLAATASAMPLLGPLTSARAHAATRPDLRFRALWRGRRSASTASRSGRD
jgi:hypothetical protein